MKVKNEKKEKWEGKLEFEMTLINYIHSLTVRQIYKKKI